MATAASTASLAVLLALGVRHLVVAVNKMDPAGYSQSRFEQVERDYRAFAATLPIDGSDIVRIPISAKSGDNVVARSDAMPWYSGPALLEHFEQVVADPSDAARRFRMPVQ